MNCCKFCMYSDLIVRSEDRYWCWKCANHVLGDRPACDDFIEDTKKKAKMEAYENERRAENGIL